MSTPSALQLVAAEVAGQATTGASASSTESRGLVLLDALRSAGYGDASLRIALSRLQRPPPPKLRKNPPFRTKGETIAAVFLFLHDLQVQNEYRLCELVPLLQQNFPGMDAETAQYALNDFMTVHQRLDFAKLEKELE